MRISLFIFFSLILGTNSAQSTHVLFGERDLKREQAAVFIDKEGSLYPDFPIADVSLDSSEASLNTWYSRHPTEFMQIAKQYNCSFELHSFANAGILNDSIISFNKRKILSKRSGQSSVTFLIHGYRKPFVKTNHDRTSPRDYEMLEETFGPALNTVFVEVYWDAMYDCCFSTRVKKNNQLYDLLKEAERNALPVGLSLRKVIHKLEFDQVNMVTHSLGAKVALHALFNTGESPIPTPDNKVINVCLIAPALSGEESFKDYFERKTDLDFKAKDNYRLMIGYNEHDFVLRKKVGWFGPGPYRYVNTTLGCDHKGCTADFLKYFKKNFPNSEVKLFDLSSVGQCHLVGCYCSSGHLQEMIDYMK